MHPCFTEFWNEHYFYYQHTVSDKWTTHIKTEGSINKISQSITSASIKHVIFPQQAALVVGVTRNTWCKSQSHAVQEIADVSSQLQWKLGPVRKYEVCFRFNEQNISCCNSLQLTWGYSDGAEFQHGWPSMMITLVSPAYQGQIWMQHEGRNWFWGTEITLWGLPSTIMRKQKRLLMNACKCNSLIATIMEF
jgi:hypothetical protein